MVNLDLCELSSVQFQGSGSQCGAGKQSSVWKEMIDFLKNSFQG